MIGGKTVSVCLVTYRRLDTIAEVIEGWLRQPIEEVILADCSRGELKWEDMPDDQRLTIVSFSQDKGNRTRHALALLTVGDVVVMADDDVMPHPGFVGELYRGYEQVGSKGIVGIIGRNFRGNRYYKDASFYKASSIMEPKRTEFVGVAYLCGRELLAYDMRYMENPVNDLFWCWVAFPKVPKHVVPAKAYANLPTSSDGGCLFHDKKARIVREAFFGKYRPKKGMSQ